GLFKKLPRCRADCAYRGSLLAGPVIDVGAGIVLFGITVTSIRATVGISDVRRPIRKEYAVEEIVVGERPIAVVIRVRPESIIKNIRVGIRPIHSAIPWDE